MFNFKETDFLMSSQCHLSVNFKLTGSVHDHKGKNREKRVGLLLLVEWLFLESFKAGTSFLSCKYYEE